MLHTPVLGSLQFDLLAPRQSLAWKPGHLLYKLLATLTASSDTKPSISDLKERE